MKNYIGRTVKVSEVLVDDHIKVGGRLFRVTQISPGYLAYDKRAITLQPVGATDSLENASLMLHGLVKIKIYNQK